MTKHRTITGFVAVALARCRRNCCHGAVALALEQRRRRLRRYCVAERRDGGREQSFPAADFNDRWSAISALSPLEQTSPQPSP